MKIRKMKKSDEEQIVKLLQEYDKYEHKLDKRFHIDSKKDIKDFFNLVLKNKNSEGFVADVDSKIIGFISGEIIKNILGKEGRIHQLIISKDFRKKDYGKKLLIELERCFKKKGCKKIQSFVFVRNKKVLKFYNKLKYSSDTEGFMIKKKLK